MLTNDNNLILIDAHVHIYRYYNLDKFFDAAFDNFRKVSKNYRDPKKIVGILCLTERKNERVFQELQEVVCLKDFTDKNLLKNKTIDKTEENVSLRVRCGQEDNIILIACRQIVTEENLEILALGSLSDFEDGSPLGHMITEISNDGAIPVIPWGFGKWTGKRKIILEEILSSDGSPVLFVGDNGNRPKFGPKNTIFKLAKKMNIKNMPGSDPLPFADECKKPGSYGFALKGSLNFLTPWKDLKIKLLEQNTVFEYFGELESPLRFLLNQLKMQFIKRVRN